MCARPPVWFTDTGQAEFWTKNGLYTRVDFARDGDVLTRFAFRAGDGANAAARTLAGQLTARNAGFYRMCVYSVCGTPAKASACPTKNRRQAISPTPVGSRGDRLSPFGLGSGNARRRP